eukprot:GHVH01016451.1.p1 GENE.GHVH01016451.1~~GHVH01016451.1.p1  ORF type:complete len:613 (+),score=90.96 GHVH01016451.1:23-1840(+)
MEKDVLALQEQQVIALVKRRKRLARKKRHLQLLIQHHIPKFDSRSRARQLTRRNANTVVLFEKDYHGLMREIIERDYFPDLERMRKQISIVKLRDQGFDDQADTAELDLQCYLERSRRREIDGGLRVSSFVNPEDDKGWKVVKKIRQLQANRGGEYTPALPGIEAEGESKPLLPLDANAEGSVFIDLPNNQTVHVNVDGITLDQFHRKFQSEDNASFNQLMIAKEEEIRKKHAWMVEASERHNLKNFEIRMHRDQESKMIEHQEKPSRVEASRNEIELKSIVFDDMDKGPGDDSKRAAHRVAVGLDNAPSEVLAVVSPGEHSKEHRIIVREMTEAGPVRSNLTVSAKSVPKSALFFAPDAKKQVFTEPKLISTSSTRLAMRHQLDDVLSLNSLSEVEALRSAKAEYDKLSEDVKEKVDEWLLKGGTPPNGVELIQRGEAGKILRDKITKQMVDDNLGYEFLPESEREMLGRSLADEVLEKRRVERFSATEMGRKEKGSVLKSVMRTPSSQFRSALNTPYGSTTGFGNLSTLGTPNMMSSGVGNRDGTPHMTGVQALNPFLVSSDLIRGYVKKASEGPLSSIRRHGPREATELPEDSTNITQVGDN